MSLYTFGEPSRTHCMRAVTANQAAMAGVTEGSFICACCRLPKNARGRKQLVKGTSKFGYKCAECVGDGR